MSWASNKHTYLSRSTSTIFQNSTISLLQKGENMMHQCWMSLVCWMSLRGIPFHQLARQCLFMVIQHIPTVFICKDHFSMEYWHIWCKVSMSPWVKFVPQSIFGDIINYFKFLDFKKDLKLDLSPIGKMYIVCALLRNALTCLYGNTTSEFFQLDPPSLEDYFA